MTRIGRLFENLKRDGHKGLIAYITAGDPAPDRTPALVEALVRGGADLIELGVPFSDPLADGPVIQRGGQRALKAGTTLKVVLDIARRIRQRSEVPLLLFTYLNPVIRYGLERLGQDAARAGIDGCLLTDASVEEAYTYVGAMHQAGLDTVFLAAPTSNERRIKLVARYSTGFVYLVSRTGVTGERESLSDAVTPLIRSVRAVTDLPLAVGFGISKPEHVGELGRQVEAVAVGSAFVRLIERNLDNPSLEIQLESFTRELKHGFGSAGMNPEEARLKLEEYRVLIDDVDRRIVELLNERTRVVENIGRVKREAQLPIYEPKREEQVFANITGANQGPLTEAAVRRVFERIIDEMRAIQRLRMVDGTGAPAGPPRDGKDT